MRFKSIKFSKEGRFDIGIEVTTAKYYIAIPVNLGMVDDLEYYEIDKEEFDRFDNDIAYLKELAQKCRERKKDGRLLFQPGIVRGTPC